jgi:hypothetical protein
MSSCALCFDCSYNYEKPTQHLPAVAKVQQLHRLSAELLTKLKLVLFIIGLFIDARQVNLGIRVLAFVPGPGLFEANSLVPPLLLR